MGALICGPACKIACIKQQRQIFQPGKLRGHSESYYFKGSQRLYFFVEAPHKTCTLASLHAAANKIDVLCERQIGFG